MIVDYIRYRVSSTNCGVRLREMPGMTGGSLPEGAFLIALIPQLTFHLDKVTPQRITYCQRELTIPARGWHDEIKDRGVRHQLVVELQKE